MVKYVGGESLEYCKIIFPFYVGCQVFVQGVVMIGRFCDSFVNTLLGSKQLNNPGLADSHLSRNVIESCFGIAFVGKK